MFLWPDVSTLEYWYLITLVCKYPSNVTQLICNLLNSCFYALMCLLWNIDTWLLQAVSSCNVTQLICNLLNSCFYDLMCLLWNTDTWLLQYVSSSNVTQLICNLLNSCFYDLMCLLWTTDTWLLQYVSSSNVTQLICNLLNSCFYDLMCLLWNTDTWILQSVSIPAMSHSWYVIFWIHVSMTWFVYRYICQNVSSSNVTQLICNLLNSCFYNLMCLLWNTDTWLL